MMKTAIQITAAGILCILFLTCASGPRLYEVPPSEIGAPRIPKEEIHEPFVPEEPKAEGVYEEKIEYKIRPERGHIDGTGTIKIEEVSGGKGPETVSILLEKREIDHADIKWYTFILDYNGLSRRVEGKKSIPYVRGSRSLWWNEIRLRLDEPLEGTLEITVIDGYADRKYRFTVEKLVEKVPAVQGDG